MKKTILTMWAFFLASSSVFSQVQEIPKFSSDAEKVAWIAAHPVDYQQMSGETLPVSNPTPEFTTQADKDAWLQANPQFSGNTVLGDGASVEQSIKEVITNPADPTFPKMILTGNPEADAANYTAAKDAWYAANPANDQAIGGTSPDATETVIYMSQEEFNALPAEKQASVLSDSNFVILN